MSTVQCYPMDKINLRDTNSDQLLYAVNSDVSSDVSSSVIHLLKNWGLGDSAIQRLNNQEEAAIARPFLCFN